MKTFERFLKYEYLDFQSFFLIKFTTLHKNEKQGINIHFTKIIFLNIDYITTNNKIIIIT